MTRANTVGLLGDVSQRRIGHVFEFGTKDDRRSVETDLHANMTGDQFVVACQNLHFDAVALHCGSDVRRIGTCRIFEGEVTCQDQRLLVGGAKAIAPLDLAPRYGEHDRNPFSQRPSKLSAPDRARKTPSASLDRLSR